MKFHEYIVTNNDSVSATVLVYLSSKVLLDPKIEINDALRFICDWYETDFTKSIKNGYFSKEFEIILLNIRTVYEKGIRPNLNLLTIKN